MIFTELQTTTASETDVVNNQPIKGTSSYHP
jgi:hypothetical protein